MTGCGGPLAATPPPTLEAVTVTFTPALRPLGKALQACAEAHPEIALFPEEAPASTPGAGQLAFRLGEPPGGITYAAGVAREEIVVLLNEANPLSEFSADNLHNLFSGHLATWDELGGSSHPVQVWTYPAGEDARQAFEAVVLRGEALTSQALLAPDPAAMLEAVSTEPGAVGYLPRAWLEGETDQGKVKTARLEAWLSGALRLPVLAVAAQKPAGGAYILLACLQGQTGRQALEGTYAAPED